MRAQLSGYLYKDPISDSVYRSIAVFPYVPDEIQKLLPKTDNTFYNDYTIHQKISSTEDNLHTSNLGMFFLGVKKDYEMFSYYGSDEIWMLNRQVLTPSALDVSSAINIDNLRIGTTKYNNITYVGISNTTDSEKDPLKFVIGNSYLTSTSSKTLTEEIRSLKIPTYGLAAISWEGDSLTATVKGPVLNNQNVYIVASPRFSLASEDNPGVGCNVSTYIKESGVVYFYIVVSDKI
jgi:hypothetical protein